MSWSTPTTTQGTYQQTDPNTVSHTCAANTNLLVVVLFVNGSTARTGGAPTYNSLPLTDSGAGFVYGVECGVEIWYRVNPPTGSSYTVSVPNTNTVPFDISVMSFISTSSSCQLHAYNSSTGDSNSPSTTVTNTAANLLMIGGLGSGDRDYATKGANYTLVHQYDAGNQIWMSEYDLDSGSSGGVAVDFTTPHADDWGVIGVSFEEITATDTSDSTATFLKGSDNTLDNQPVFLKGSTDTLDSTPSYLTGSTNITDSQSAYLIGQDTSLDTQPSYTVGASTGLDTTTAYTIGQNTTSSTQLAYLKGPTISWTPAWVEGTDPAITDIYSGKGRLRFANLDNSYARVLAKLDYEARPNLGVIMSYQFNSNVGTGEFRVWLRSSNDWYAFDRPTTGYELTLTNNSSTIKFYKVTGGTRAEIDSWTGPTPDTNVNWIKFQIADDNVRVKLWADGAGEPANWSRTKVDTSIPTEGGLQMGYFRVDGAQKEIYVDSLSTFVTDESFVSVFTVGGLASSTPAFLQGPSGTPTSDSTPAYLSGTANTLDTQSGYTSGQDTTSDTQAAFLSGSNTALDSIPVYLSAENTATNAQFAYLAGLLTSVDTIPAYTSGVSTSIDTQPTYLRGSLLTNDTQSVYTTGGIDSTDSSPAYTEGESAAIPTSDTQPAYLGGQDEATNSTSSYTRGQSTATDAQVSYTTGQSSTLDTQPAYTAGSLSDTSGQVSYLTGQDTTLDTQPAFLAGSVDTTTQQDSYLTGQDTALDTQTAWLAGGIVTTNSTYSYIKGQDYGTNSSPAYLLGSLDITDSQASYTAGQDSTLDSQAIYLKGQDDATDSSPAFLTGQSTSLSSSSAFAQADDYEPLIPDGNITIGSWKNESEGSSLWSSIDEYPFNDSDYVYYDGATGNESFEVSLSDPNGDPLPDGIHTILWRTGKIAGTSTVIMKAELMQGAIVIATDQQTITDSFQTFEYTLTSGEISNITDYTDLRIRFTVVSVT